MRLRESPDTLLQKAISEAGQRIEADKASLGEELHPLFDAIGRQLAELNFNVEILRRDGLLTWRKERLFREQTRGGVKAYQLELKSGVACWLLRETLLPQTTVAELLRLRRQNFRRDFKSWMGLTPSEYRSAQGRQKINFPQPGSELTPLPAGFAYAGEPGKLARVAAEGVWRYLRHATHASALQLLRAVPFASPELFELLSEKGKLDGRKYRPLGVQRAELALATVEGSAPWLGPRATMLLALAHARLGNARRLAADLDGAEAALDEAEAVLATAPRREPRAEAEIRFLRGTLWLFRRRFPAALALLTEALELAREAVDPALQVDVLVQCAAAWCYSGDPISGCAELEAAKSVLRSDLPEDATRHYFVHHELVFAQIEAEQWETAARLLPKAKQLAEEVEHIVGRVQLDLAEGLLLRGQGHLEEAERMLREVRSQFLTMGDVDTTSVVTLDLAIVCQQQGRIVEVRALVAEVLELLESLSLENEAQAAYQLLQKTAVEEASTQVALESVRKIVSRLMQLQPGKLLPPPVR